MVKHNRYFNSDNQPFQRIIVYQADGQTKVGCSCCCYAEVRSVTASLSHVGYLPFTCEGSEPPTTDTRYLKYRASGDGYIEACGVAPQHQNVTQEWEVDPFTGLTCYNGPESDIVSSGCSELQNCSATQKSYSCALEGDPNDDPCATTEGGSINWTESLQDSYTIEDVASNVDTVLGRINPYGNDGMPAGTRGSVINGTNGSILTWVNECALNRAGYISGAGGVTKTKLFVKFTKDTQYTLTQSNGSVQTLNATEGQEIIVETPSEPNTWTDITIAIKTKVGCCNSSIGATTHTGETTDSTFVADEAEGQPPPLTPFIGPDCKQYLTVTTNGSSNTSCGKSANYASQFGSGSFSASYSSNGNSSSTSTITNNGIITNESNSNSASSNSSDEQTDFFGTTNKITVVSSIDSSTINGVSSCSGTRTRTTTLPNSTTTSTCNPCTDSNCPAPSGGNFCIVDQTSCTVSIAGPTITVIITESGELTVTDSGDNGFNSTETSSSSSSSTSTTTYSGLVTSQDQLQSGTWEDETSPNESLCASRTESETTKQSKNVDAEIDLAFTAPASESPITYEHWFHYYTVEVDNSEEGCPTSDVVAHNEKWTSVSSGGVLTLSRNINLSTPPKDHSICAQSLAFVTRVAS